MNVFRCYYLLVFLIAIGNFAQAESVYVINVIVSNAIDSNENANAALYLKNILKLNGTPAELAAAAQGALESVGPYELAQCSVAPAELKCVVHRHPILTAININGLPLVLLQKELISKLPVRIGDIIAKDMIADRLSEKRIERQVQAFLQANGYHGSVVTRSFLENANKSALTLKIDISGSYYLRVNKVTINGFSPVPASELKQDFRSMCMSLEESFSVLAENTFSCYSKGKLHETIGRIKAKMDELGYFQASVVARGEILESTMATPAYCTIAAATEQGKKIATRCVDIEVSINAGPQVLVDFILQDAQSTVLNKGASFFRNIFGIELLSRVANSSFVGNKWPADETIIVNQLRQAVTFGEGRVVDQSEVDTSIQKMKEVLALRGYYLAQVNAKITRDKKYNRIYVNFTIDPGIPYRVAAIKIQSNTAISEEEVLEESDLSVGVRSLGSTGHLTSQGLKDDVEEIRSFFHRHGYEQVGVKQNLLLQSAQNIEIRYSVEASKRKTINTLNIVGGTEEFSLNTLSFLHNCERAKKQRTVSSFALCQGSPFIAATVSEDAARISNYYRSKGYLYAQTRAEISEKNDEINLTFYVSQFEDRPVEKIPILGVLLQGNQVTQSSVMLRHMNLSPPWKDLTPDDIDKGVNKLRQSRLFSRVSPSYLGLQQQGKALYAEINVVEKPSLILDSSFSLSSDELFALELNLKDQNIFGTMLDDQSKLVFGLFWGKLSSFEHLLFWPRIAGSDFALKLTLPSLEYRDLTNMIPAGRHFKGEIAARLAWDVFAQFSPYFEYKLRLDMWQNNAQTLNLIAQPRESLTSIDGLVYVLKEKASFRNIFEPGFTYTDIDNPFNPRKGVLVNLFAQFSPGILGQEKPYTILGGQFVGYIPVGPFTIGSQIIARRAFIDNPTQDWWVLKYQAEMDSLGGDASVRGYYPGYIGVYGPERDSKGAVSIDEKTGEELYDKHSGNLSLQAKFELRYPLAEKFLLGQLIGSVFVDIGYVNICTELFSCEPIIEQPRGPDRFGLSVGTSVGVLTPVGPISLAYAISPIHSGDGLFKRQERLHFIFGFSF